MRSRDYRFDINHMIIRAIDTVHLVISCMAHVRNIEPVPFRRPVVEFLLIKIEQVDNLFVEKFYELMTCLMMGILTFSFDRKIFFH
jgi:hypothetical protein